MKKSLLFISFLLIYLTCSFAQNKIEFLKKNSIPISVDVNKTDFSDLQKLKDYIGNNRLVMLGEESHGDGTTFETKTRIIKFLHEQMGFNILAFESSFYNAEKAWKDAIKADDPMIPLRESVFHLWSHSNEAQNLFEYVTSKIHQKTPLKITGFDCQYNADGFYIKNSGKDLEEFLYKNEIGFKNENEKSNFYGVYNRIVSKTKDSLSLYNLPLYKQTWNAKLVEIGNLKPSNERDFWLQHFVSSKNDMDGLLEQLNELGIIKLRDSVMAQNVLWLMNKEYPNDKIIIWAHNFHIAKSEIRTNCKTMGQYLADSLGSEKIYNVAFIAYEGEFAWFDGQYLKKIRKPNQTSFDNLFHKTQIDNLFFDLRTLSTKEDGKWLNEIRTLRYNYYQPSNNSWTKVYDALIFNNEMKRSTDIDKK